MDGIIVVNKEKGYTSHDVVAKVKKVLGIKKVGHTGTLDPNATGVLPILLNKGTQLSKYLINHDKTYEVMLKLGEKTETADCEGRVIEKAEVDDNILRHEKVLEILNSFKGKQNQVPPIYSAIKLNGKKMYEYARKGEKIEIQPREIEIYNIELIKIENKEKMISFKVECSKGTYIRSLCEDISKKLGTIGYMKELKRLRVGKFDIEASLTIEQLENKKKSNEINDYIITVEDIFKDREKIDLKDRELNLFLNGAFSKNSKKLNLEDGIYRIYNNEKFIGTGISINSELRRDIII